MLALQSYEVYALILKGLWVFFVFAFGACFGSLTNVLVYRLPLGLGIVTPPSRCPACDTRLTWRENIPIFGWILLRGRCRFCKSKISPEYPLVELVVATLFAGFFALWYLAPDDLVRIWWGAHAWSGVKPEWAMNDPMHTWPTFVVVLMLLGPLVGMTLIDARTYTIPLGLAWFPAVVALIVHPLHALWLQEGIGMSEGLRRAAPGASWSIPTPTWTAGAFGDGQPSGAWWWVGASIGVAAGLAASMAMLWVGLIGRSFADYAEWEAKALKEAEAAKPAGESQPAEGGAAQMWIEYPHARREMVRELAFLAAPVLLGLLGGWLAAAYFAPATTASGGGVGGSGVPLWLDVLGGVLMGYLIGGGVVWVVRVLGSLGFGREAMGLGDVHLMGAVGACIGWVDAVLAFFLAAFVGVGWFAVTLVGGSKLKRALPYGPYLAVATVLVLLFKPLIEWGLSSILQLEPGQPPINIP